MQGTGPGEVASRFPEPFWNEAIILPDRFSRDTGGSNYGDFRESVTTAVADCTRRVLRLASVGDSIPKRHRVLLEFSADCSLSWQSFASEAGSTLVFAVELKYLDSKGPHQWNHRLVRVGCELWESVVFL